MQHLTVQNIPQDVATALRAEKHRRRQSLNQTVIELLRQSIGVDPRRKRSNGLARLAGTWTEEEHERFEVAVAAAADQIDDEPSRLKLSYSIYAVVNWSAASPHIGKILTCDESLDYKSKLSPR